MPNTLDFGQDMPSTGGMYLKVKEKGDTIQFLIAKAPTYVGKHFLRKEDGWDVPGCPRINSQEDCDYCVKFFKAMAELKKLKEAKAPEAEWKPLETEARKWGASTTFYFPVLDRATGKFGILQTTQGVRNQINAYHENGTDVLSKEFILRNTGKPGKEKYLVTVVDSADTKDLSNEEVDEYAKAQAFDPSVINDGASNSDESLEQ